MVAPIVWLLTQGEYEWTLLLFAVAAVSDALDGFLAKNFGWQSEIGALLDPIADKALLISVFVTLGLISLIPAWLLVIVVARDVVIVSGAVGYQLLIGRVEGCPTGISKINTGLQLAFVLAVVAQAAYQAPPTAVVQVLGSAMFVTTVVSGMDYVWSWGRRAWRVSHEM